MQCICGGETRREGDVDYCARCELGLPATPKGLQARRIVQEYLDKGYSMLAAVNAGIQHYYRDSDGR